MPSQRALPHNDCRRAHFDNRNTHLDNRRSHDNRVMMFVVRVAVPSASATIHPLVVRIVKTQASKRIIFILV